MARKELKKLGLLNEEADGRLETYVSDRPQRFHELAERFLGHRIEDVEIVALP